MQKPLTKKPSIKKTQSKSQTKDIAIWNIRMLELRDYVVKNEMNLIGTYSAFDNLIGVKSSSNVRGIKAGSFSFTPEQMHIAGAAFNVDMNWIHGYSNEMFLKSSFVSPLDRIKDAVRELENIGKSTISEIKPLAQKTTQIQSGERKKRK